MQMTETVTYLTTIECENEHERVFAHQGPWVPVDSHMPLPEVHFCPECAVAYPDDLAVAIVEQHEAEISMEPEVRPGERL